MLTKSELEILDTVKTANRQGALAGLGTTPKEDSFQSKRYRFVKRLFDAGSIVYVEYTGKYGAGWALPEYVDSFTILG